MSINREDLKKEILESEEFKNLVDSKFKELESKSVGRWKPSIDDEYYRISDYGFTGISVIWTNSSADLWSYFTRNCFKTEEERSERLELIKTHFQLMDIAERLNEGEIDWDDAIQYKYYLYYDYRFDRISHGIGKSFRTPGIVYCLSEDFEDVAIKEIGSEKLTNYLKEY